MGRTIHEHCNPWQTGRIQPDMSIHCESPGDGGLSMKSLCLALLACLPLAAAAGEGSISKVNGSVRVEAGQSAGDVSTVNGSVTIEEGATAEDVETVNGSINIERNATVAERRERQRRRLAGLGLQGVEHGDRERHTAARGACTGQRRRLGRQRLRAAGEGRGHPRRALERQRQDDDRWPHTSAAASRRSTATSTSAATRASKAASWSRSRTSTGSIATAACRASSSARAPWSKAACASSTRSQLLVSDRAKIGAVEGAKAVTFSGDEPSSAQLEVERN